MTMLMHAERGEGDEDSSNHSSSQDDNSTEGRILPVLPIPVQDGEDDPMHLEQRRGEVLRSLLSYLRWMRTRPPQWRNMQTALVEGMQIAAMSATMQAAMLVQALNVARQNYVPETVDRDAGYEAVPPTRPQCEPIAWWGKSSSILTS